MAMVDTKRKITSYVYLMYFEVYAHGNVSET